MTTQSPPGIESVHQGTPRRPLSCDRIVDAAVCFVDANCLADLSMRRLGSELGVEAMSLYRYFPSKRALLDAVTCRVLGQLRDAESGPGDRSWEDDVRAHARAFRRVAREHPNLLPLLATVDPANDALREIVARMRALWKEAGFDRPAADRAQRAVLGYVIGSSLRDPCDREGEAAFEFGLDALLAGLQAQLPAS